MRLIPRTLALMAVQRQTAASRSARPARRLQHGVFGGVPTTMWTKSFNKLAHTPSFRASLGQEGFAGCECGCGFDGEGGHGTAVELTNVKKRRLRIKRNAVDARAFEAIAVSRRERYEHTEMTKADVMKMVKKRKGLYRVGISLW